MIGLDNKTQREREFVLYTRERERDNPFKLGRFIQKQHEKSVTKSVTKGKQSDFKRFANANLKLQ